MIASTRLVAVADLARAAGAAIMQVYAAPFTVQQKDDDSPVTEADLAAHRIILAGLQALTPEIPVLSEEGVIPPPEVRARWVRYWLVDPLDGTREFVARNGEFTVNIALVEGDAVQLGVVFAPALDELFAAEAGQGAWLERAGTRSALRTRAWPAVPSLLVSRAHPDAEADRLLASLSPYEALQVGSSLKYCRIAQGLADAYPKFGRICPWDTAAGQCVLEQAGGAVLALPGLRPLRYPPGGSLKNPAFIASGDARRDWAFLVA